MQQIGYRYKKKQKKPTLRQQRRFLEDSTGKEEMEAGNLEKTQIYSIDLKQQIMWEKKNSKYFLVLLKNYFLKMTIIS